MNDDVVEAKVLAHLKLWVRFADGVAGYVTFLPSHLTGVFESLKNPSVFEQVQVTDGFVSWKNEIDLAPDSMYEAIKQHGEWTLA